jgi:phospholipase C
VGAPAATLYPGRIYPGLRPFDVEDALLFFGREEQTDELLRRLDDTRFLAVVGLSGSGKSSLVRAGLLPALRRGHLASAGSRWQVAVMRPGSDPLGALASVLNETLGEREDRLATLRSGRLGLLDSSRQGRTADQNLLLVVDQFEEIFRFQDTHRHRAGEAAEFVELLLAASQEYEPTFRVYVVITLRSDYLGECARFSGLPEALNESQYLVPRMARERLCEAIEGPAALGGVALSKELREELLDKTGDDPDQLPVLQHLLMRMWEIRKPTGTSFSIGQDQYQAVGGWDNALNKHAETVWNSLGERRDLAKRMFQRLTEKGTVGREVRRPATVHQLSEIAEVTEDEVTQVADHFRGPGCNFLTSPDRELTGNSVIDISHESLIRRWKQLNEWTAEEAAWGEWYRRVEDRVGIRGAYLVDPELQSAVQAQAKGRWNEPWAERYRTEQDGIRPAYADVIRFLEDSRKRRSDEISRLRRTRVIVAVVAVLFAALSVCATYFWLTARKAHHQAEAQAQELRKSEKAAQDALGALDVQSRKTREALATTESALAALDVQSGKTQAALKAAQGAKAELDNVLKTYGKTQQSSLTSPVARIPNEPQPAGAPAQSSTSAGSPPRTIKHVIVLMMVARSFDHMLGALKSRNPQIDGLAGSETNPDTTGATVKVRPLAAFQGQLNPDPDQHFPAADVQIFGGDVSPTRTANMQGFVKSYYNQRPSLEHSQVIMYYFTPDNLPVLTTLAQEFAVCDRWFSSVPGPSIPNRTFAHYGTSFGHVDAFFSGGANQPYKSIFERLLDNRRTAKLYFYDLVSSVIEMPDLLRSLGSHPETHGTFQQFLDGASKGNLPEYSFIEPNFSDHTTSNGAEIANDQHPDHNVQAGEFFIAEVYNAIRNNESLWRDSVLVITYSSHGGIYDHVRPPAATPDGFVAAPNQTGTGREFAFDRLGVRVPAVIVSPWIPKGTVDHTVYDHASIPATVSKVFLSGPQNVSPRERSAHTFEGVLTLKTMRADTPVFDVGNQ